MGVLSGISDTLFGDQGKGASRAQSAENRASRAFIAEGTERARGDVQPLFAAAQQARQAGSGSALDVLGGALPAQLQAFQGGNVGAQQALLGGQPNFQNAILGLPQQQQQQAFQVPVDLGFIPQGLPEVQSAESVQLQQLENELVNAQDILARNRAVGGKKNRQARSGLVADVEAITRRRDALSQQLNPQPVQQPVQQQAQQPINIQEALQGINPDFLRSLNINLGGLF